MNDIVKRHNEFSLEEFYNKSYNGAVIVITPNQIIKNIMPNEEHHRIYLGRMYNLIYGSTFDNNDIILDAKSELFGNNIVMMLDKFYTLMYVPYKINSYQLQEFLKLNEEYKNISLNITFGTFNDKIWDESENMNKAIEYLKSIIDNNITSIDKNILDTNEKVR